MFPGLHFVYSLGEKIWVPKPSGWEKALEVGFLVLVGGALVLLSGESDDDVSEPAQCSRDVAVDEHDHEEKFYDVRQPPDWFTRTRATRRRRRAYGSCFSPACPGNLIQQTFLVLVSFQFIYQLCVNLRYAFIIVINLKIQNLNVLTILESNFLL